MLLFSRTVIRLCSRLNYQPQRYFGNLSARGGRTLAIDKLVEDFPDDADGYDKEVISLEPKKHPFYYKWEIYKQASKGAVGLRSALELFKKMQYVDHHVPEAGTYTVLITGCARQGLMDRAFQIFRGYLKHYTHPTNAQIVSLITVCGLTPYKEEGLERLEWLREYFKIAHNKSFNELQYISMIKAYGALGRLDKASDVVQEMVDKDMKINIDVINNLLYGCAQDEDYGLGYAVRLYKRIKFIGLKPDLHTYRTMLRAIKNCQLGSNEFVQQMISELPAVSSLDERIKFQKLSRPRDKKAGFVRLPLPQELIDSIKTALTKPNEEDCKQQSGLIPKPEELRAIIPSFIESSLALQSSKSLPNLLSDNNLDLFYRIAKVESKMQRHQRFRLLGGTYGYLATMARDGVQPDTKIFTAMVECLKGDREEFLDFYRLAKDYNIKRDQLFYDMLLRSICNKLRRFNQSDHRLNLALEFVEKMHMDGLRPNIATFEALALACDTKELAKRLIDDMRRCDISVSGILVRYLFDCALYHSDINYLNWLIKYCQAEKYSPDKRLVDLLELKRVEIKDNIRRKEKGLDLDMREARKIDEDYIGRFEHFSKHMSIWLSQVELRVEEHPWKQFDDSKSYQSKRRGFIDYEKKFKKLQEVKQEALERGEAFGNLTAKAERRLKDGS